MQKRKLSNGWVAYKAKSPVGEGDVVYLEAGPEGKVFVLDSSVVPVSVMLEILAWVVDKTPPQEPNDPHLKPKFDRTGFVF